MIKGLTLAGLLTATYCSYNTNRSREETYQSPQPLDPVPIREEPSHPVPEPSTLLLLGTGLVGLAITGTRKWRRSRRNYASRSEQSNI